MLPAHRLPEVASKALVAGADSPALRVLAGLTHNEIAEVSTIWRKAISELGLPVLGRQEAARIHATAISKQIINGDLSPEEGAKRLWDVSIRVNDPDFHDLDPFVYAASELQSRPEDRDFFSREIVREARAWASKPGM